MIRAAVPALSPGRALAAALVLAATPAFAADLTGAEIAAELVGRPMDWWEADGWHAGALTLSPDGRAEMTVDTPVPALDEGRWTLRGDRLCTRWTKARAGGEKCYGVVRGADGGFLTSGGNILRPRAAGV